MGNGPLGRSGSSNQGALVLCSGQRILWFSNRAG